MVSTKMEIVFVAPGFPQRTSFCPFFCLTYAIGLWAGYTHGDGLTSLVLFFFFSPWCGSFAGVCFSPSDWALPRTSAC